MNPQAPLRAILFDLDGTLIDSYPAHFAAYCYMFRKFGIEIDEDTFLDTYTPNWYKTYEKMNLPEELWEQASDYWLEEAARHPPVLFPGVAEALARLEPRCKLGVVTSGSKSRIDREMAETGIQRCFRVVVSGDDVTQRKPDPQGLEMALAVLEVPPVEAVYVGDANADCEMAAAAGVRFIGVPSRFDTLNHDCEVVEGVCKLDEYLWGQAEN